MELKQLRGYFTTGGASRRLDEGTTVTWESQKGLDASYNNCQGWMQMACCLKVYLESGTNLREFFF